MAPVFPTKYQRKKNKIQDVTPCSFCGMKKLYGDKFWIFLLFLLLWCVSSDLFFRNTVHSCQLGEDVNMNGKCRRFSRRKTKTAAPCKYWLFTLIYKASRIPLYKCGYCGNLSEARASYSLCEIRDPNRSMVPIFAAVGNRGHYCRWITWIYVALYLKSIFNYDL